MYFIPASHRRQLPGGRTRSAAVGGAGRHSLPAVHHAKLIAHRVGEPNLRKDELLPVHAGSLFSGFWFSPDHVLQALIDNSRKHITFMVRMKPFKGNATDRARKARSHFPLSIGDVLQRLQFLLSAKQGGLGGGR